MIWVSSDVSAGAPLSVEADPNCTHPGPLLLQYHQDVEDSSAHCAKNVMIDPSGGDACLVLLSNSTHHLEAREYLGEAVPATVIDPPDPNHTQTYAVTTRIAKESDGFRSRCKSPGEANPTEISC